MSETKQIRTATDVTTEGGTINIHTYYEAAVEALLNFFIRSVIGSINSVSFLEGESGYTKNLYPNFSASVSDRGDLIIIDDSAELYSVDNNGELLFGDVLAIPVSTSASVIFESGFTANWNTVVGATKYYLDVALDSQFNTYVAGFQNKDVGNVLSYIVTGLSIDKTYYYRVRAYDAVQLSMDSNIITTVVSIPSFVSAEVGLIDAYTIDVLFDRDTFCKTPAGVTVDPDVNDFVAMFSGSGYTDWFLPSLNLADRLITNLYNYDLGNFNPAKWYWTSSEVNATDAYALDFTNSEIYEVAKGTSTGTGVRACRSFTDVVGAYALRDTGPAGGLIFHIVDGTTYYEAAPSDQSTSAWSNVTNAFIGTTSWAVAEGQNNTNEIISQAGHTTSAAKTCDDLVVSGLVPVTLYYPTLSGAHLYVKTGLIDWFCPSKDELNLMYVNLKLFGVGGFTLNTYHCSSEYDKDNAWTQSFNTGVQVTGGKNTGRAVRSCRSFTSSIVYALRDVTLAGGWIFSVTDNGDGTYTYLEAASSDQSAGTIWSNITGVAIGTTSTAIGTGQTNTTAIINQAGHTTSAAKLCDDLVIGRAIAPGETGTIQYIPGVHKLQGTNGALVSAFTKSVTNNVFSGFIITVDTTKAGSASDTMVIPTYQSGYDCSIDWGDEYTTDHTGTPGNISHQYAVGGVYTIKISGTFPAIRFNDGGDKLKLMTIEQWGNIVWGTMNSAFNGCANLTGNYSDIPNTSLASNMSYMFKGCSLFNSPVLFNTSSCTSMFEMFRLCTIFNQSVSSFDTGLVESMGGMFRSCTAFNQPVDNFNTALVYDTDYMFYGCTTFKQSLASFDLTTNELMTGMLQFCNINETDTTTNYDDTLVSWAAQTVHSGISFHGGTSKYSLATGKPARDILTGAPNSWTITDGGQA